MASFLDLAEISRSLGQTHSRSQMTTMIASFLAGLDAIEAPLAARLLVGQPLAQGDDRKVNLSGRAIWRVACELSGGGDQSDEIFAAAVDFGEAVEVLMRLRGTEPEPSLTIAEIGHRIAEIAAIEGGNSRARKLAVLRAVLDRATSCEAGMIARILTREMRHGVSEGIMLDAIALMANRQVEEIRRLHMFEGDLGRVIAALRSLKEAAAKPVIGHPVKPMLASPVRSLSEAFEILGARVALEHKLDGARVQIHREHTSVRVFSRQLKEISRSVPEVVAAVRAAPDRQFIVDGEIIAVDSNQQPMAFQSLMRRFGRVRDVMRMTQKQPVMLVLFDLLAIDSNSLIDRPFRERIAQLDDLARQANFGVVQRIVPASLEEAEQFYRKAIETGVEGVMVKALDSDYHPGVRGRGWLKLKHARTLDLVIVAAEWGYGRRHGWLSNYHLAARDEVTGEFKEVGKTFKGPSDEEFQEMTEQLMARQVSTVGKIVKVRAELVVEVAFGDIQRSPTYPCGLALRFARIVRLRDDKNAAEADTVATIMTEFERQARRPH